MKTSFLALLCGLLLLSGVAQAQPGDAEPADFAGMLQVHNDVRSRLQLPPLRWSREAARQAQGWADQLARENCALRYNPDERRRELYGENLMRAHGAEPYGGWKRTAAQVAQRWAEEGAQYDHASHTCRTQGGTQCGQYLQMIWDATEVVGCGRARCPASEVWVCNYTPRGGQEGLKPYGNPPPAPAPEVTVGALECRVQVAEGEDLVR
jgi:hypothetical protein